MSLPVRAMMIAVAAGLSAGPAAAQLLGPTWETEIVLTKGDFDTMLRALDGEVHGRAVGTVALWRNPITGHFGTIELMREYQRSGRRCERIDYTIRGGDRGASLQHWMFDSCLQPDGSWKFARRHGWGRGG
jgi:surface antigen